MATAESTSYRVEAATSTLWFGRWPSGWGEVVHGVAPGEGCSAAAMIDAAGLAWTVEQYPLEAVLGNTDGGEGSRVPVPRVVANVRSDTRAVLGVDVPRLESARDAKTRAEADVRRDGESGHPDGGDRLFEALASRCISPCGVFGTAVRDACRETDGRERRWPFDAISICASR